MNNKKFRVYHKDLQKYLPAEEWCLDFYGKLIFVEMSSNCKPGDYVKLVAVDPNLYIAEQFTGLYDETGREIYENDILLFEVGEEELIEGNGNIIGLVVFTHGHYYFMDNQSDEPLNEFSEKRTEILDLKIIGNINQNKELLN